MNHNSQKGMFTSSLARAIRFGSLLLMVGCFFWPALAQGQVRRLSFAVQTADDDLRGGQDNLNVAITLRDGREQWTKNVNHGQSWGNQTMHTFDIGLQWPVPLSEIGSITFQTSFTGGVGGDNWNMGSVSVKAMGDGIDKVIVTHGFMRFTGENKSLLLPVVLVLPQPGKATKLEFTIKTGDDDLRGNSNNLNVTIHARDGSSQLMENINGGRNWANGSTHTETINLNQAVDPSDVVEIDLNPDTSKTGGQDQDFDNWNMESISVRAIGEGVDKIIARHGFYRFKAFDTLRIQISSQEPGKANKLEFIFQTGGDDLRGDGDNLDVTIYFRGGRSQAAPNINGGEAWRNASTHTKVITLEPAVKPSDIVGVRLQTTFTGGVGGDNWDMNSMLLSAIGEGMHEIIAKHDYFRFTKSQGLLSIPLTGPEPGKANKLELTIKTGGDDLRGDNDDLNITVFFRDGARQTARNINSGKAWANGSTHMETITLNRAVDPADIVEIDLEATFSGGTGGDNWDMDSVTVKAVGEGVNEALFRHGPRRFTHDNGFLPLKRGQ